MFGIRLNIRFKIQPSRMSGQFLSIPSFYFVNILPSGLICLDAPYGVMPAWLAPLLLPYCRPIKLSPACSYQTRVRKPGFKMRLQVILIRVFHTNKTSKKTARSIKNKVTKLESILSNSCANQLM